MAREVDLGSIVGPKGDPGPQGPQGPPGAAASLPELYFDPASAALYYRMTSSVTGYDFYIENATLYYRERSSGK